MSALPSTSPPPLPDDLRGARLIDADLAGVDLTGRDLTGADLSRANLRGAILAGATLTDAVLWQADLTDAQLLQADLRRADLREARLGRAGLGHADLRNAVAFGADLRGATLTGARCDHVDLRGAQLEGARIMDARLHRADFASAQLDGADMHGCDVSHASFRDARFGDARIRGLTQFATADWVGADLRHADLGCAQMLARCASDQNYLWEFRNQSRAAELTYWVWWVTSDCGRSFTRWTACIALVAVAYAGVYTQVGVDFGRYETPLSPLYFSIVTLMTLGYGDAIPSTTAGQVAAMSEVVVGYVMLGGLLSLFAARWGRLGGT
jgi:uncharacterized protein YjbI with pentapeptide repeats